MSLSISEMPCSFTGQALYAAATSRWLGMSAQHESDWDILRVPACLVYNVAVNVFCAPTGIVYHSAAAIVHRARAFSTKLPENQRKQALLASEHFQAACTDVMGLGLVLILMENLRKIMCDHVKNRHLGKRWAKDLSM